MAGFSGRDFGVQSFGDSAQLALVGEQVIQVAMWSASCIRPRVRSTARLGEGARQLCGRCPEHRYTHHSDLAYSVATVIHDTRAADYQISDLRQPGQNVVLHAIGKGGVFFPLAEVFKRQHSDSGCEWMMSKFTFPNDPAASRRKSDRQCDEGGDASIPSYPFPGSRGNSGAACLNGLVLLPALQVLS